MGLEGDEGGCLGGTSTITDGSMFSGVSISFVVNMGAKMEIGRAKENVSDSFASDWPSLSV